MNRFSFQRRLKFAIAFSKVKIHLYMCIYLNLYSPHRVTFLKEVKMYSVLKNAYFALWKPSSIDLKDECEEKLVFKKVGKKN